MGSEASNSETRAAVGAAAMSPTIGPEEFPRSEINEGGSAGNVFGDKKFREVPSEGEELCMGLSERVVFHDPEGLPDKIGQGRNESNGKPMGPQKGAVKDLGTAAKFIWG